MAQRERHALIVCQGGRQVGLGHLRRGLSLARALRDACGYGVRFAGAGEISDLIDAAGFTSIPDMAMNDLLKAQKFDLAVVDVKDSLTRADVARLAGELPVVAVIDDGSDRRLAATHAYYPPVPQAYELSWEGTACKPRLGWEWCILGFDPAPVTRKREAGRIVVSMGGADPLGLTGLALQALQQVSLPFQADIVIGPAFGAPDALMTLIQGAGPSFRARTGVNDPAEMFAHGDLALVAFGITAYELAALGVPALYLPISEDHRRSAGAFAAAGIGEALPVNASPAKIAQAITRLLQDDPRRREMTASGPRHVDGKGAGRIAADLAQAVEV